MKLRTLDVLMAAMFLLGAPTAVSTVVNHAMAVIPLPHVDLGAPLNCLLFLFVFSLGDYLVHRFLHTRWGWWLHRLHHEPGTYWAPLHFRHNPLYFAFMAGAWCILLGPIGTPAWWAPCFWTCFAAYGALIHTEMPWGFGPFLQSPARHRRHHTHNAAFDLGICPLWDHVFGTTFPAQVSATGIGSAQ